MALIALAGVWACHEEPRKVTDGTSFVASNDAGVEVDSGPDAEVFHRKPDEMVVFAFEAGGSSAMPLEGAIIGVAQDGEVTTQETDSKGRATFRVNPAGGALVVSGYQQGYVATTYVGYNRALDGDWAELEGHFLCGLSPLPPSRIDVEGELVRIDPASTQTVLSSTEVGVSSGGAGDYFWLRAIQGMPFTLTAFEQVEEVRPYPSTGMTMPISSWRTLKHEGADSRLDLSLSRWETHELAQRTVRVVRPTTPASLASDETAMPYVYVGDAHAAPGEFITVAAVSGLAPWNQSREYEITLTGPRDALESDSLVVSVVISDTQSRATTIASTGRLPKAITEPFLSPPVLANASPATEHTVTWNKAGSASIWTLLGGYEDRTLRWYISAFPSVSSLDLSALLATLPTSTLRGRDLNANLTFCELESGACRRHANSFGFALMREGTEPAP